MRGRAFTGTNALANLNGVNLKAGANTVGPGNVISGNTTAGIYLESAFLAAAKALPARIIGNLIGTDATGTRTIANRIYGIYLNEPTSSGDLIGGPLPGGGNLISGNASYGLNVNNPGAVVQGNLIGTDLTGLRPLANGAIGNFAYANQLGGGSGASNYVVGGVLAAERNVVSGNNGIGLSVNGANCQVLGNFIGVGVDGQTLVTNSGVGLFVSGAANRIGAAGAGNVLSGNGGSGLLLAGTNHTVQGNFIGTDASGTGVLTNGYAGIYLSACSASLIGGTQPGEGNVIAHNSGAGVHVTDGVGNRILGNAIFQNGSLGILLGFSPTPLANDALDADTGPNQLQNFPVLAAITNGNRSLTGALASEPNKTYRLEFFASRLPAASGYGDGETLLGAADVTTDANGNAPFNLLFTTPLPNGQFLSATATDPDGNTSEFGLALLIPTVVVDTDSDGLPDEWELRYFATLTGASPAADGDNDRATNLAEFLAGTDPTAPNSVLRIQSLRFQNGWVITFLSATNKAYHLQGSTNLIQWINLATNLPGTGNLVAVTDTNASRPRFNYRLQVVPP